MFSQGKKVVFNDDMPRTARLPRDGTTTELATGAPCPDIAGQMHTAAMLNDGGHWTAVVDIRSIYYALFPDHLADQARSDGVDQPAPFQSWPGGPSAQVDPAANPAADAAQAQIHLSAAKLHRMGNGSLMDTDEEMELRDVVDRVIDYAWRYPAHCNPIFRWIDEETEAVEDPCKSSDIAERLCDFSAGLSDILARRPQADAPRPHSRRAVGEEGDVCADEGRAALLHQAARRPGRHWH